MSFAEFFFAAKNRITDPNSQLARDTRGRSITNGCSAKTKLTSDVSLVGNWSEENKLRVRAVGSSLKAILMTVVPRGTYLTDNPHVYPLPRIDDTLDSLKGAQFTRQWTYALDIGR
ncbi:hypothetical protein LAZ67_X000856 [Cordylochernes scorpioides]|uniref:Uncharacterized protein n=1 Tax=Cordylochernes scorpioides TaxID=51811 RepID=A0ABY6LV38_9ARAC|nr:hypothetical protein LAZ67_X000856 [Cordylochernes scorpioides]